MTPVRAFGQPCHFSRRDALGLFGAVALSGLAPRAFAKDAPNVLGGAVDPSGGFRIGALDEGLAETFGSSVPVRLHALSPRPGGGEAVAVGRRPADLAFVLDGRGRDLRSTFHATEWRRFSGHGAYSADGATFFSAEIDATTGEGFVVRRDPADGYAARAAFGSSGVGPHELIPVAGFVAVANGSREPKSEPGIAALGRTKARSNVAFLHAASGAVERVAEIEPEMASLSLRHLVRTPDGSVLVAAQDTATGAHDAPLIARIEGERLAWLDPDWEVWARFAGSIGQLSIDVSGRFLAASGPIGGVVGVFDLASRDCLGIVPAPDCCAVAADGTTGGFIASTGLGEVIRIAAHEGGVAVTARRMSRLRWDNHLAFVG